MKRTDKIYTYELEKNQMYSFVFLSVMINLGLLSYSIWRILLNDTFIYELSLSIIFIITNYIFFKYHFTYKIQINGKDILVITLFKTKKIPIDNIEKIKLSELQRVVFLLKNGEAVYLQQLLLISNRFDLFKRIKKKNGKIIMYPEKYFID